MNRLLLFFSLNIIGLHFYGQGKNDLSIYYMETAKANSPLIADFRNQSEIEQAELERLKAMYTHSRLELNGDYLFVPVVSKDGGHAMHGLPLITTVMIWARAVVLFTPY